MRDACEAVEAIGERNASVLAGPSGMCAREEPPPPTRAGASVLARSRGARIQICAPAELGETAAGARLRYGSGARLQLEARARLRSVPCDDCCASGCVCVVVVCRMHVCKVDMLRRSPLCAVSQRAIESQHRVSPGQGSRWGLSLDPRPPSQAGA